MANVARSFGRLRAVQYASLASLPGALAVAVWPVNWPVASRRYSASSCKPHGRPELDSSPIAAATGARPLQRALMATASHARQCKRTSQTASAKHIATARGVQPWRDSRLQPLCLAVIGKPVNRSRLWHCGSHSAAPIAAHRPFRQVSMDCRESSRNRRNGPACPIR